MRFQCVVAWLCTWHALIAIISCHRTPSIANMPRRVLSAANNSISQTTTAPVATAVEHVTLTHQVQRNSSISRAVNFTIFYPANCSKAVTSQQQQQQQQWCQRLPILFLMNGANVRAADYTTYATLLAQRGYTFVGSDYYQQLSPNAPPNPLPESCPKGQILAASAGLINTFLKHASSSKTPGLENIMQRGIVLVGHSMGAVTALNVLTGDCHPQQSNAIAAAAMLGIDMCEGYQPTIRTVSSSGGSSNNSSAAKCPAASKPPGAAVTAQLSSSSAIASSAAAVGKAQAVAPWQVPSGLVLGAVVFEGYKSKPAPPGAPVTSFTATGLNVPPSTFLLAMAGQYGINRTATAFQETLPGSCACAGLAAFEHINHFGINDFQPNGKQITPCGRKASFDPADFAIDRSVQNAQLQRIAAVTDVFIRESAFKDVKLQPGTATGYTLQLKGQCTV